MSKVSAMKKKMVLLIQVCFHGGVDLHNYFRRHIGFQVVFSPSDGVLAKPFFGVRFPEYDGVLADRS